jgi:hypothetical protein
MYLFYIDDSGNRDPEAKGDERVYVLAAVCIYEKRWRAFEDEIMHEKLRLLNFLKNTKGLDLSISDTEIKSNYLRRADAREKRSPFLHHLDGGQREALARLYYTQLEKHRMRVFLVVIDKEKLWPETTGQKLHLIAYRLLLEKMDRFMRACYPSHMAMVVTDNTDRGLIREVTEHHALLLHHGGKNSGFHRILEYPFFAESTLSHGVQLADLCAYNAYRAFTKDDFSYPYFEYIMPYIYKDDSMPFPDGLLVFPPASPKVAWMRKHYSLWKKKREPSPDGSLQDEN